MKKHYFFLGTVVGLALIPVVAYAMLGIGVCKFLLLPTVGTVVTGYGAALSAARLADQGLTPSWLKSPLILAVIFLFGVASGSVANLFVSGHPFHPPLDFVSEVRDYVFKPAFWLTVFGTPCALLLGVMEFLVYSLGKNRAQPTP